MAGMDAPLRGIVGDKAGRLLASGLDLHTVGDLLRHFPRSYENRTAVTDLRTLRVGEHVTVLADVQQATARRMRHRPGSMMDVVVGDGRRTLKLVFFFKAKPYLKDTLTPGRRGLFAGTVGSYLGVPQLTHPRFALLDDSADAAEVEEFAGGIIPIYRATAKLDSWAIGKSVRLALHALDVPADPLPDGLREREGLVALGTALHDVHRPPSYAARDDAVRRLKWDEALALQVTLAQRRHAASQDPATARAPVDGGLRVAFDERLPFVLTDGQRVIGEQLAHELAREHPMHRLLQGEVGSGKTVCALRAMLQVVDAGGQAALLAPTEVLAAQHHRSLTELLGPLAEGGQLGGDVRGTRVALLTGSQGSTARRRSLLAAASGEAGIIVGTHALIQEHVQFADLGLVVVDEQHRFGVEQRDALRAKGSRPPHVLVMTATPIPRTVAMTVFGDLDTSSLAELPCGRSPITTHVVPSDNQRWVDRTWELVREEVAAGHQAFVVCPRIGEAAGEQAAGEDLPDEPSETDETDARRAPLAVLDVAPLLTQEPLRGLRVEVLHGRLPGEEKDAVMRRFADGGTDVLIATTVIEVGVDVANATVMVVMDADRFGVSQLHQLRGRIGRGSAPGACLLVTEAEAPSARRERLDAVAGTLDGFALARLDLELRREGDVLGARQSGRRGALRLLSLLRDEELIAQAREQAQRIVAADPTLSEHPALAGAVADLVDEDQADYLEKA